MQLFPCGVGLQGSDKKIFLLGGGLLKLLFQGGSPRGQRKYFPVAVFRADSPLLFWEKPHSNGFLWLCRLLMGARFFERVSEINFVFLSAPIKFYIFWQ
uniref:Pelota-1 n=1 Tax=Schmidtea mediterranea TaxID=79327 RepID=I1ZIE6_SCHMD|nr:pelota-1 [Schmidtea mediterranea]